LATTTSAVATSFRTISRPFGAAGSNVIPSLLRFIARNIAPPPVNGSVAGPAPTGIMPRSSPPPIRSMRITSAPRSPSSAAQNGPAM
jgi:hypothetical protein